MKNLGLSILLLMAVGCAGSKMGKVEQPIDRAAVNKTTTLYVYPVTAKDIKFEGDKSADTVRTDEEKKFITTQFHTMIVEQLRKKGYTAELTTKKKKGGFVVKGNVRHFDHGSAAARGLVGMGAGSSNMFTDFKILDMTNKKVLAKFEVIATSGGRGGWSAMGSFMEAHLEDGAEKVADYISGDIY